MKNIQILKLSKHTDVNKFELMENGIYKDLTDNSKFADNFRIGLSFEIEDGEDSQYPLESVLDKYSIHVSDFIEIANTFFKIELGGQHEGLQKVLEIVGKRVYERPIEGKKGIELVIE